MGTSSFFSFDQNAGFVPDCLIPIAQLNNTCGVRELYACLAYCQSPSQKTVCIHKRNFNPLGLNTNILHHCHFVLN